MAQTTRCYNSITVGTLSSHRSWRRNGEESCEEGRWRQEEGREEAVGTAGGVLSTPPSFCTGWPASRSAGAASRRGHPTEAGTRARRQLTGAGADDPLAHPHG